MRAPLDDAVMAEFVARLDEINALAEGSPGFCWRLKDDDGTSTAFRVFDDATLLINLSVWATLGALRNFVYHTMHRELLHQRQDWFEPIDGHHLVIWAVPQGHEPSVGEACERLMRLRRDGPSMDAFTFASTPPEWRR